MEQDLNVGIRMKAEENEQKENNFFEQRRFNSAIYVDTFSATEASLTNNNIVLVTLIDVPWYLV